MYPIDGVISLTTWKQRISTCGITIYNLLQMCPRFHIVLVLSTDEFPNLMESLPHDLKTMYKRNLFEILPVRHNYKSFKKVIFTLAKYPTLPIISADDDCLYKCNYANELLQRYKQTKCPIITYNKPDGWCKTEGPCTLYNPSREPFCCLAHELYTKSVSDGDDGILTECIEQLKLRTTYVNNNPYDYPFVFHTTKHAMNPTQYTEDKYKKCLMSS